jgi:hypothetical protein
VLDRHAGPPKVMKTSPWRGLSVCCADTRVGAWRVEMSLDPARRSARATRRLQRNAITSVAAPLRARLGYDRRRFRIYIEQSQSSSLP